MPEFLIRIRIAIVVLGGLASWLTAATSVQAKALPVRPQAASPLSPGAAAAADSLLVKLAHLRAVPGENQAIWASLVEDARNLARRSGLQPPDAVGRVTATNYVISTEAGWVAGPDADAVVGKWLAILIEQTGSGQGADLLGGAFHSGVPARVGLRHLLGQTGETM